MALLSSVVGHRNGGIYFKARLRCSHLFLLFFLYFFQQNLVQRQPGISRSALILSLSNINHAIVFSNLGSLRCVGINTQNSPYNMLKVVEIEKCCHIIFCVEGMLLSCSSSPILDVQSISFYLSYLFVLRFFFACFSVHGNSFSFYHYPCPMKQFGLKENDSSKIAKEAPQTMEEPCSIQRELQAQTLVSPGWSQKSLILHSEELLPLCILQIRKHQVKGINCLTLS